MVRGTVRAATNATTTTASGTSSGFATCSSGLRRTSQSAANGGPTWQMLPTPCSATRAGTGQSTSSDPARGTRGTAYHRGGAAAAAIAQSTADPAAASVIRVAPSSKEGRATATVSTDTEAAQASWRRSSWCGATAQGSRTIPARTSRPTPWPSAQRPRRVGYAAASTAASAANDTPASTAPLPAVQGSTTAPRRRPSSARPTKEPSATAATTSALPWGAAPRTSSPNPSGAATCGEKSRVPGRHSATETSSSDAPATATNTWSDVSSQPAVRAPSTSSTTSPRETTVSASAATPRSRRASPRPASPVVTVSATSTMVRPSTPSHDQATARKIAAATRRQVAPRPRRILGTEGMVRPEVAAAAGGGAGYVPAYVVTGGGTVGGGSVGRGTGAGGWSRT